MANKLITIVGNVATGKSTLTQLLSHKLPAQKVPADDLYKSNPFFQLAVEDRKRWSLASDLWFLKERVKMARDFDTYLENSDVVVDSGLPMTQAYTHSRLGHGFFTKDEWNLYQECYDVFTRETRDPDIIVYLKAPVSIQLERIKLRGRDFEIKHHNAEYLKGLSESVEHIVESHQKTGIQVIEIDTIETDFSERSNLDELINKIRS